MAGIDIGTMIRALRSRLAASPAAAPTDDPAAVAKQGAESIARRLPSAVMPMQAIEEDRRRKAAIDQMLEDAGR